MAGQELGPQRPTIPDLKEQLVIKTLKNVRQQGHPYVDIRKEGKRHIFFCVLCLSPLYGEAVLFDHLRGNSHKKKYEAAKLTLFGPNPWPFNDGLLFFHNTDEEEKDLVGSRDNRVNLSESEGNDKDLVVYEGAAKDGSEADYVYPSDFVPDWDDDVLVIPGVIGKEKICDLRVRLIGYGKISARYSVKDAAICGVQRLWCEWLGNNDQVDAANNEIPLHDFAIVTFSYYYHLGKQGLADDLLALMPSEADTELDEGSGKRRRKSSSEPEDIGGSSGNQCDSSGDDSRSSSAPSPSLSVDRYDGMDQLLHSRMIMSKSIRKQLRRKKRYASQRLCDLCHTKMLPGKDVATLVNLKTGRLACSSRNVHGVFHVFHVSCLLHWILLCELEISQNKERDGNKPKRRNRPKGNQAGRGKRKLVRDSQINTLFCPECQGTGIQVNDDELEQPTVTLSQIFNFKIKSINARQAYMQCPEELQNCSTGFHFPPLDEDVAETVSTLKLLRFYQAEPQSY